MRLHPIAVLALVACGFASACERGEESARRVEAPAADVVEAAPASEFVGSRGCTSCHPDETEAWTGSHHDLAMQPARPDTVLARFDDTRFEHRGESMTFRRRGDRFLVEAEGPDGERGEFEIAYTFGVEPLQQYLVKLPGGRLQALTTVWDTRPKDEGGQRWYPLYPDENLEAGDPLHWTGLQQRWNHMCADCHSTGLHKRYDAELDRYDTSWHEIDVACEACHGPASRHVLWAEARDPAAPYPRHARLPVVYGPRAEWRFADGAAIAQRVPPGESGADVELDTCGRCHSRRSQLAERDPVGAPLLDAYRVALLEPGLYHADGQLLDEVYVYGSFLQSRMHAAGVTCRDCHDPHSLELGGGDGPDAVCSSCHRPEAFASPDHHHHPAGSAGASCVACHMPARVYMGLDARRDHSFRVPRPDLAEKLGVPDACTGCHSGESPRWASEALAAWQADSRAGVPHFAEVFTLARAQRAGAHRALLALIDDEAQPAIVRATALVELGAVGARGGEAALREALASPDPLLRLGALAAAESLEPRTRLRLVLPSLRDPLLSVRLEAERVLRAVPPELWPPAERGSLADVQRELRAVLERDADRPEAWTTLASLAGSVDETEVAVRNLERAIELEPSFVPAYVNLADFLRALGRDSEAEPHLLRAAELAPESGDVQYALGLLLVRLGRGAEATAALARAAELSPRPRYALAHALSLRAEGRDAEALQRLEQARTRFPEDRDLLATLATLARDRGDLETARQHARALLALDPGDPQTRAFVESLEAPPRPTP